MVYLSDRAEFVMANWELDFPGFRNRTHTPRPAEPFYSRNRGAFINDSKVELLFLFADAIDSDSKHALSNFNEEDVSAPLRSDLIAPLDLKTGIFERSPVELIRTALAQNVMSE
jgi:hypothetical protein